MQSCKLFGTSRLAGGFLSIQKKSRSLRSGIFLHAMQHKKFALSHSIWQQGQKY